VARCHDRPVRASPYSLNLTRSQSPRRLVRVGTPDDEIECPGCDELVDVRGPLRVEVTVIQEPTITSHKPTRVTIAVGGASLHRCDEQDLHAEGVARLVGELLRDDTTSGPQSGN
jgi:hypothetical protein